jgi:Protein of unknown function (DUF4199)
MKPLTARTIGLITSAAMIAFSVIIYTAKNSFENNLQYVTYAMYVAGILWTLIHFKQQNGNGAGFKQFFAEGFKCFALVSFLMVMFTLVFLLLHPELKEQMAVNLRAGYATAKDLTQVDIENRIAAAKKFFLPGYLMGAVLGYLAIGALVTAVGSVFLSRK